VKGGGKAFEGEPAGMKASLAKGPARPLAALIRITPSPNSTIYTTAVLSKLRTFGEVIEFKKLDGQERTTAGKIYHARFSSQQSLNKALDARPLTVDVGTVDAPHPQTLDPYNAFGLQDRRQITPASFTCTVTPRTELPVNTAAQQRLIQHGGTKALYDSLLECGAPMNQIAGFSMKPASAAAEEGAGVDEQRERASVGREPLKLMDLYRDALSKRSQ